MKSGMPSTCWMLMAQLRHSSFYSDFRPSCFTHLARHAGAWNGSAKYCVSRTTFRPGIPYDPDLFFSQWLLKSIAFCYEPGNASSSHQI